MAPLGGLSRQKQTKLTLRNNRTIATGDPSWEERTRVVFNNKNRGKHDKFQYKE